MIVFTNGNYLLTQVNQIKTSVLFIVAMNPIRHQRLLTQLQQLLVGLLLLFPSFAFAQNNISINSTGFNAHPSAILDVFSTSGGMLVPRMTQAERTAIGSPADGLIVFQTDAGQGFWYWDGTVLEWRMLPRYNAGNIEMGPPPSTIIQGQGYAVNRIVMGNDQIDFNASYGIIPNVMLSGSFADGEAPFLEDYCSVSFASCNCHHVLNFELFASFAVGVTPLITNMSSGCNTEPGAYIYYPPGHPVYAVSGDVDLCLTSANAFSLRYRGGSLSEAAPCGTNWANIYIDWQQDGFHDQFDDRVYGTMSEVVWATAGAGGVTAGNLPIPIGAFSGNTLMRVIATPNQIANSCPGGANGETEAYNVYISCRPDAVYQDVRSYCNIGDVGPNGMRVSCRRLNGEPRNIQNYYFQVNEH